MDIPESDIRCSISIRGIRSSTTKEMIHRYCEKYGQINYIRCANNLRGIGRGYNIVFKQEQTVNHFMDDRPHRIDGQSVKVKRCIPSEEEWRLTNVIIITTTDSSNDKQIFQEQTLCDYFSRYGSIRACHIDTYHNHPCAYLTFADYDRVDQLINDKPHIINKMTLNVRKHILNNNKSPHSPSRQTCSSNTKRRQHPSTNSEQHPLKRPRPSKVVLENPTTPTCDDTELLRLKTANALLIREAESIISTPTPSKGTTHASEIGHLRNDYERFNTEMISIDREKLPETQSNEILRRLQTDVERLLQQINSMQTQRKTFAEELFDKYTIEYVRSLTEHDLQQRREQLEKENQLLLLIKQNMPKK